MNPTRFLRFPSEAAWIAACQSAGYWITQDPPRPLLLSHTHNFDVIGVLFEGGVYDPETGEVLEPPTVLEGWHVNAKVPTLPEGWDAYLVTPAQPQRIFSGDPVPA
jgi:hypothetical protein